MIGALTLRDFAHAVKPARVSLFPPRQRHAEMIILQRKEKV
jgi:hypothetical protein